jgi:hypothetical protein
LQPTTTNHEPPRAGPFLAAAAPIAVTLAALDSLARSASLVAAMRLSPASAALPLLGACAITTVLLVRWPARSSTFSRAVRAVCLALSLGLAMILFEAVGAERAELALGLWGAWLGVLLAGDAAAIVRALRASKAAAEPYAFQRAGLPRVGVLFVITSPLVVVAVAPSLGAVRTLFVAAALTLAWFVSAVWVSRGAHRLMTRGLAAVLAVGTCVVLGCWLRTWLVLPLPRTAMGQRVIEALPPPSRTTTAWMRPLPDGAILRVHSLPEDLVLYEAYDDVRSAELFVHPAATLHPPKRALVIGNESGSVARELLKYPGLSEIVHVSFFEGLAGAFSQRPLLRLANAGALVDPRVRVVELARAPDLPAQAASWGRFSLIIVATTAPLDAVRWGLSRETLAFYERSLEPSGVLVRRTITLASRFPWCFVQESAAAGWYSAGARMVLPSTSMEEVLVEIARREPFELDRFRRLRAPARTLDEGRLGSMFVFGRDQDFRETQRADACVEALGVKHL